MAWRQARKGPVRTVPMVRAAASSFGRPVAIAPEPAAVGVVAMCTRADVLLEIPAGAVARAVRRVRRVATAVMVR